MGSDWQRRILRHCRYYHMSKRQFLAEHTSAEISELFAFENKEPFAQEWHQTGQVCSTLANIHRTKGSKKYEITDFIPIVIRRKATPLYISPDVLTWFGAGSAKTTTPKKTKSVKPVEQQQSESRPNSYGYYRAKP